MEEYITTQQAAKLLGVDPATIRRACKSGRIRARKFGWAWYIETKSLGDFVRSRTGSPKRLKA
jgi:excisionase family DNA binding protein